MCSAFKKRKTLRFWIFKSSGLPYYKVMSQNEKTRWWKKAECDPYHPDPTLLLQSHLTSLDFALLLCKGRGWIDLSGEVVKYL